MYLCGVRIDFISLDQTLDRIKFFLKHRKQHYLVTVNPEFIVWAQKDNEFRDILNQADLSLPDGIGILLAAKFLRNPSKERVRGVDISQRILESPWAKVFLLGGKNGAAKIIAQNNPSVSGFTEDLSEAIEKINQSGAQILLVALGAPRQEKWIKENLSKCPTIKVAMGVGGSFDFLSGRVRRAPKWLQKIGLEWLWRLVQQPRRLPRIWRATVVFLWLVVKNHIKCNIKDKI